MLKSGNDFLLFVPRITLLDPIEVALRRQFPKAKFETVSSQRTISAGKNCADESRRARFSSDDNHFRARSDFPRSRCLCRQCARRGILKRGIELVKSQDALAGPQNVRQEKLCIFIMGKQRRWFRRSGKSKT